MPFKKFKKLFTSIDDFSEPQNILRIVNQLQSNIQESIVPLVSNIQNDSTILTSISLKAGQNNVINHTLNRDLIKWTVVRQRGQARIWDAQDGNPSPNLTLWLHTDTDVSIDLEVA